MYVSLRALQIVGMLYIELPIGIFLLGWVKPVIGIPLSILLAIQFLFFVRESKKGDSRIHINWKQCITLFILAGIWVLLSGAGHRGIHAGDYYKHNALLNDLIRLPWPTQYSVEGSLSSVMLVYYTAYYLPAALWGKVFGWGAANIFIMMWTYGGVMLVALWLSFFFPKKPVRAFLLFIVMSGLDGLGRSILYHRTGMNPDWEWWAGEWQYSGITTLLFHVPQHALGAWIFISMLLSNKKEVFTLYSSLLLWSPFVWVGSLPFVIVNVLRKKIRFTLFDSATAILIGIVLGSYVMSSMFAESGVGVGGQWLWERLPLLRSFTLIRLLFFYLFEFGICFGIIMMVKHIFQKNTGALWVAFALLLCIPWYRLGLLNDFAMRVSVPALFVLALYSIHAFLLSKKVMRYLIYVYIFIASIYPALLIINGSIHIHETSSQLTLKTLDTPQVRKQYIGKGNSVFSHVFAKENYERSEVINLHK